MAGLEPRFIVMPAATLVDVRSDWQGSRLRRGGRTVPDVENLLYHNKNVPNNRFATPWQTDRKDV